MNVGAEFTNIISGVVLVVAAGAKFSDVSSPACLVDAFQIDRR